MSASHSSRDRNAGAVVAFYDRHPINEEQILNALHARGVALDGVTEEHLKEHDQDHYGGVPAVEALACAAGIVGAHHVLDVCSGMGGPARYLAHTIGCRVTGLDLTESRVEGARRLTKLTGLDHLVDFRTGNALEMPFGSGSFDVVIAEEAWAHIPHKPLLVAEAVRVLKPGGVLAFTDIVHLGAMTEEIAARLRDGMAFVEIESLAGYSTLLKQAGCETVSVTDLSGEWTRILRERLAMYRSMKASTVAKFGEAGYLRYDSAYSFFVSLYERGVLGGARYVARRLA